MRDRVASVLNLTQWRTQNRPLRFTLSVTITALIIAASLSILTISYYGSARSLLLLAESTTAKVSEGIIERIHSLLNSSERANASLKFMIEQGMLDPSDGERTMDVAAILVSQNDGISSLEIGLPDGSKYKALREADGSVTRYSDIRTSTDVRRTYHYEHADFPHQQRNTVSSLEKGYDARKRPWFITAVSAGKTVWTDMFVSGTLKQFEYSCVTPIYGKDQTLKAVAAVNVDLKTLSHFLGTLKILAHGRAFVMNDRDQVIAIPIKSAAELDQLFKRSPSGSEEPYQLYRTEELPDQDIRTALVSYRRDGLRFFEFEGKGGEPNIVSFVRYPYRGGSDFTVGIIFPKNDIMGSIARNTRLMLLGVLLFLLFAVLVGFRVARGISSSLAILCDEVDKVSRLELDSNSIVESRILEVSRIDEAVRNMKRGLRSFRKYVPVDLVLQLNAQKKEAVLEGEKRELSIFFSDIANFTSISERLTAEELVQQLGTYFNGVSRIILDGAGTVDKYIGDAVMAFWGAPVPRKNHARLACAAALECQRHLDRLSVEWEGKSQPVFRTRIGIHTGEAIVGNIGYEERMNYTIIGDAVNLASRLEGLNKYYQTRIIISDETFSQVQDEFVARKLDRVAVKGKTRGLLIYELISARGEDDQAQTEFLQTYDRAMELYLNRSWAEAEQAFAESRKMSPGGSDFPSEMLGARCAGFMRDEPGSEWSGVYTHNSK